MRLHPDDMPTTEELSGLGADAERVKITPEIAAWFDSLLDPTYGSTTVTAHLPGSAVTPAGRSSGSLLPSEDAQPPHFPHSKQRPAARRAA